MKLAQEVRPTTMTSSPATPNRFVVRGAGSRSRWAFAVLALTLGGGGCVRSEGVPPKPDERAAHANRESHSRGELPVAPGPDLSRATGPTFVPVASRSDGLRLQGEGPVPVLQGGAGITLVRDSGLEHDPAWIRGVKAFDAEDVLLIGEFPQDAWLFSRSMAGRESFIVALHRWNKDRWVNAPVPAGVASVTPWKGGRLLGFVPWFQAENGRSQFRVVAGPRGKAPQVDKSFNAWAVSSLPTGEVAVVGQDDDGHSFAQRWAADGSASPPEPLPSSVDTDSTVRLRSKDGIYVALPDASFLFWDGSSWTTVDGPPGEAHAMAFDVSRQGTIWAGSGTREAVWKRPPGGTWSEVRLSPEGEKPDGDSNPNAAVEQVWVNDDADPWFVVRRSGDYVALRQGKPLPEAPKAPELPSSEELWRERQALLPITPATRACKVGGGDVSGYFVSLGPVGDGLDPELLRSLGTLAKEERFSGVRFVEVAFRGERRFGAEVVDFAQGALLMSEIRKNFAGHTTPHYECHVYVVSREVNLAG